MKKTFLFAALALIAGGSLTSCKDDTEPRLEAPTEFHLNTPPMANFTYVLSKDKGIDLTVSQPDYGLGVVTSYQTQISYTENFAEYENVETISQQAKINLSGEEFAQAMCRLMGYVSVDTEDKYVPGERTVYVRVRAFIPNAEYSSIESNVIKLQVVPFKSAKLPGRLYVIGEVNGWDINSGALYVEETAVGSQKYVGTIYFTAEQAAIGFRFYQTLGSWGDNGQLPSVGSNADDGDNASVMVDENGVYNGSCTAGKGNWNITNWTDGNMRIEVDMATKKVTFEKAAN